MPLYQDRGEDRGTLHAHISSAPMRLALVALAAVVLPACSLLDGDPPPPLPAGVTATVDGRPFLFNLTMGWAIPGTDAPLSISGARMDPAGMRMIQLTVPARVGTYTAVHEGASAGYIYSPPADSTLQMWLASGGAPGTSLDVRVTAVDGDHAEGTFAFTARPPEDTTAPPVVVTGGTFNVALGPPPPDRRPGAILGEGRAFDGARLSPAR